MHNIDRTNLESSYGEYTGEFPGEYTGEYTGEYGAREYGAREYGYESEGDHESYGEYQEGPFSEAEEMELAAELLAVSNEGELDQFLGKLFKKASRAVGGFLKSGIGKQLAGAVKNVAKQALPTLGGIAGNFLLPGVGGAIGSQLASGAGSMFGLELEGLSYEDQEFELAKQVVRLGSAAAANAAQDETSAPPLQAAQTALTAAAQQHAPGLLTGPQQSPAAAAAGRARKGPKRNAGRWVRQGNVIVLIGA